MRFKAAKTTNEIMVMPTFGWINERYYYGYPVIAIAFAWLCWRCKIEIGVKKHCYQPVFEDGGDEA